MTLEYPARRDRKDNDLKAVMLGDVGSMAELGLLSSTSDWQVVTHPTSTPRNS